ncbi:TrmH family RNA methyltransferase [Lactobacillus colini]|uniref:TrmH family RNA methyltransferase n=1 Tax=Lactobacillus colini TaxID=1819254 RepID=A0ABS4MB10_9LACO|nr:RNA methyltransferase [Lactobacillus colini]MBP2056855.1 TrmH family RNA methyltransferase [Lactobacillus colini]
MLEINSVNNRTIKDIRKLEKKKYRKENHLYLIEGFHLVIEALQSKQKYLYLLGTQEALERLERETHRKFDDDRTILINEMICDHLSATKNSQDIFMVLPINQPKTFSFEYGRWVILDNVTDPGNVGTIIRTADAAGFDGVVLSQASVDLYNPKVQRSMQGSQFHIQIIQTPVMSAIASFKENGLPVYVSVLDKEAKKLNNTPSVPQLALIIGNEAHGASQEVIDSADKKIYIPLYGQAESLNAAVAAGIMIYHFA